MSTSRNHTAECGSAMISLGSPLWATYFKDTIKDAQWLQDLPIPDIAARKRDYRAEIKKVKEKREKLDKKIDVAYFFKRLAYTSEVGHEGDLEGYIELLSIQKDDLDNLISVLNKGDDEVRERLKTQWHRSREELTKIDLAQPLQREFMVQTFAFYKYNIYKIWESFSPPHGLNGMPSYIDGDYEKRASPDSDGKSRKGIIGYYVKGTSGVRSRITGKGK